MVGIQKHNLTVWEWRIPKCVCVCMCTKHGNEDYASGSGVRDGSNENGIIHFCFFFLVRCVKIEHDVGKTLRFVLQFSAVFSVFTFCVLQAIQLTKYIIAYQAAINAKNVLNIWQWSRMAELKERKSKTIKKK